MPEICLAFNRTCVQLQTCLSNFKGADKCRPELKKIEFQLPSESVTYLKEVNYKLKIDVRRFIPRSVERKYEHIDDLQWVKICYKIEFVGFIKISKIVKIQLKSEI